MYHVFQLELLVCIQYKWWKGDGKNMKMVNQKAMYGSICMFIQWKKYKFVTRLSKSVVNSTYTVFKRLTVTKM